jgi:uncharacterized protein
MTNQLMHFAIHADDVKRARKFYSGVFGWGFEGFGGGSMDDFCMMRDAEGKELAPLGAMQKRKYNVAGKEIYGFECTIQVKDLDATAKAVVAQGGKIVMERCAVPTVGWLIKFLDTECNLVVAMQPDPKAK